ncbi:(S)-benzoin forming benzil reductase [Metabacillus fastidiosus]|uniref:(S)-benzoin forming benzil reductase n=2 Tax=Metabacillus fastidiosus TaxID=1458 RepID=UPI0008269AF2|nr:(S)-benzoin forming benzil reductase [Metabacillus fastidiosus]MED4462040.1 (S)-benzoin forming benzil reductase [Metabacillus fastidiosus]
MKYFIITGTSRGIGASLAKKLLDENHHIFCISRSNNQELISISKERDNKLSYYQFDLYNINKIDLLFEDIFKAIKNDSEIESIYLINNAGVLSPLTPCEENKTEDILRNVNINLIAPMVITSNFIKHTNILNLDKRIMNISSGSAKYLLPSQSSYSTSKAGLDSFSKSISIEQMNKPFPVKIISVYPGVIDTEMQSEIRSVKKGDFPFVEQFIQLSKEGKLQSPEYTAEKLIELLFNENFGNEIIVEDLALTT